MPTPLIGLFLVSLDQAYSWKPYRSSTKDSVTAQYKHWKDNNRETWLSPEKYAAQIADCTFGAYVQLRACFIINKGLVSLCTSTLCLLDVNARCISFNVQSAATIM